MPHIRPGVGGMAWAVSGVIVLALVAARVGGSPAVAHAVALAVLVLALPWVVPAFVVVAVLSAPFYVALHVAGYPVALAPWLSAVVLLAAVLGCHANAVLLMDWFVRRRPRRMDRGLADFLRRNGVRSR